MEKIYRSAVKIEIWYRQDVLSFHIAFISSSFFAVTNHVGTIKSSSDCAVGGQPSRSENEPAEPRRHALFRQQHVK